MKRRMAQIEESVARYLEQLDTADRQEPSEALQTKTNRLKEKIETLKQQMRRLERLKVEMLATPDQQISLTDRDARSMATSGRGSGVVGYNVQIAVEANHHLIVMHEVTNEGTDRSQLSHVGDETKAALGVEKVDAVADRGYAGLRALIGLAPCPHQRAFRAIDRVVARVHNFWNGGQSFPMVLEGGALIVRAGKADRLRSRPSPRALMHW